MLEENHMGWKLVTGVRLDVVNLFKSFSNTNSIRYEDFCQVWKKMNFSLIFRHRVTFIELLEFTEELLQIVKEYLSSVFEFHTKIAALYTLYGLFFKQPIKGAAKIRFTKSEWEEMYLLMEECKKGGHYDIVFIHYKLLLSGAYTFTATLRPAGLEQGFRKYSEKRIFFKNCDLQLFYKPLISKRLVRSLVQLESLYCEKKLELFGKRNLVFIDGKFAETLEAELENYESSLQTQYGGKQKDNVACEGGSTDEPTPSTSGSSSRKTKKRNVKNRQPPHGEEIEPISKKTKPGKKYQELLAKKKAEYYIKKLRQNVGINLESEKLLDMPGGSESESDST